MTLLDLIEKADVESVADKLDAISTKTLNEVSRDREGNPYTILDKAMALVESGSAHKKVAAKMIVKLLVDRGALTSKEAMRPPPLKRKSKSKSRSKSKSQGRPPLHRVNNMRTVKNGIAAKYNLRRTVKAVKAKAS